MIIKDVIYGEIEIKNHLIVDLIQTFEFQRLRKIKQLGLTNFTFPGAEHTRYVHSIGVYYLTKKILQKFKMENKAFFTFDEEIAILSAALLHDIGHGPLSHAAETFFGYSHEDYSILIIENEEGEINKILKKYDRENGTKISIQIKEFINKTHKNKALNSLLSSSIDVDRMDYLLRDSYYTGTVYGTIDVDRIISNMEYEDNKMVFDKKSLHTLEDFILSRYHMFIQVYLNEKSLIYERLIQKILQRVFELYSNSYEFNTDISLLFDLIEKPISIKNYIRVNDYNFMSMVENFYYEEDELLKKLVSVLVKRVNFYNEITLDQQEELLGTEEEFLIININEIIKKVYSSKETIYIKDGEKIVDIESLSQIFKFSKENLEILVEPKTYKLEL